MGRKFSLILANVGSCCDRFLSGGYSDPYTIEEMFDRVASIEHVTGVELVGNWHVTEKNVDNIKKNLQRTGLKLVSIIPDHFGQQKWGKGAFSSKDAGIRKQAIEETKVMMDVARELGGNLLSLWPGQDGYDYCFQGDYIKERTWIEEGLKECCRHKKDVKISLEYKIKEPRTHSYISTVASTLLMVNEIGEDNCGVTIDFGHGLAAYENVAESVAILKKYGNKLFHIHMNDNYRFWDDDMIVGTVHTVEYLEFLYWLKKTGYNGWLSTDQYPYREDGKKAVQESVYWMKAMGELVDGMDEKRIEGLLETGDAVEISRMLRQYMFPVK